VQAFIDQLILFIQDNQVWTGPILALITMGESMLLIGIAIPATALMIATGGLLGSGIVDPVPIVLWGLMGAVLGDALSYWIGRWVGPGLLRHRWLRNQRTGVARARLFFGRYGFLAILLGRFLGPIRSTVPTVAGLMKMKHLSFQIANVLSALLWVPLMLAPGYLTARGLGSVEHGEQTSIIVGSVLSIGAGVWLLFAMTRKRRPGPRCKVQGSGSYRT